MSEVQPQLYLVRDPQGNVYGPADAATLRDWVGQGRIVAGMHIAPRETREWVEVSQHPVLADLFGEPGTVVAQAVQEQLVTSATSSPPAAASNPGDTLRDPSAIPTMQYETPVARGHSLSRISMIVGIIAPCIQLVGCLCCVGLPFGTLAGMAALVMGIVSLSQLRNRPEMAANRREAWIGIGLGAFTLFLLVVWLGFIVISRLGARP